MTLRKIILYKVYLKSNGVWTNKFSNRNSIDMIDSLKKKNSNCQHYIQWIDVCDYIIFSLGYDDRFNKLIIKSKLLKSMIIKYKYITHLNITLCRVNNNYY